MQAGIGTSTSIDALQAAKEAVHQARINLETDKIDLAVVFAPVELSHQAVLRAISKLVGPAPLVGCSSLAVISEKGIFKHGLLVSLFSFSDDIYFNTGCTKDIDSPSPAASGRALGEKLLYGFKGIRRNLSLVFSDAFISDGSAFIRGLQEALGSSFPLVGACASDNLTFKKTFIYYDDQPLANAACGILWGGKINFGLGIKHGWKPLGKPHYVTQASGNIVYAIDQKPAAQLYMDYLACDLAKLKKERQYVSVLYPLGVHLEGEEEYLLRNILKVEDDGSLVFQENIPEGSLMRIMIGTKDSCLQATRQAITEVKKALRNNLMKYVFVFDSASRYALLGRHAKKELEIIRDNVNKETKICGIYTYGEQAPLKAIGYQGRVRFHNQTIAILGIGG